MTRFKVGEMVTVKSAAGKLGTVLSVGTAVPYEGVYVRVLLDGTVLEVHESVIDRSP